MSFMDFVRKTYKEYICIYNTELEFSGTFLVAPRGKLLYSDGVSCFTDCGMLIEQQVLHRNISQGNIKKKGTL
jgi:hypothetical protein